MPLWTEAYLNRLLNDAEDYITTSVPSIFDRFSLSITQDKSVYTLPSYVKKILRITWLGKKLYPLAFDQFCVMNPASAVVSETTKIEYTQSTPLYYVQHPTNFFDIRFFPTPSADIAAHTVENIFGANISSFVIISCYRTPDSTVDYLHWPEILIRRIKKAYVLSRAFAKEGKGQNLIASKYYEGKLEFLLGELKSINSDIYRAKIRILNEFFADVNDLTPARPVLPPDYGVTFFE